MDRLLRKYREYVRAYIDDVFIHSATLEDHVQHLRAISSLFAKNNIAINPKKAFVGYPSVKLLGQKVNSFSFPLMKKKSRLLPLLTSRIL